MKTPPSPLRTVLTLILTPVATGALIASCSTSPVPVVESGTPEVFSEPADVRSQSGGPVDQSWSEPINGLEVDGDSIWMASVAARTVLEVDRASGEILRRVETPVGTGPGDVALAPNGTVYWSGFGDGSIGRIIDGESATMTIVGESANGIAVVDEFLIVSEAGFGASIYQVNRATSRVNLVAQGIEMDAFAIHEGAAIGPTGDLFVSSAITSLDLASGEATEVVSELPVATAGTLGPDGALYVVTLDTHQILRHELGTDTVEVAHDLPQGRYDNLAFGNDDTLYVSDSENPTLVVVAPDRTQSMLAIGDSAETESAETDSEAN